MSILLFIVVLFVLILVHEWGHYFAAKKTGMRVDEFGIGFPPKLFGVKRGETEYTLNAVPIGGFVKIYGENSDSEPTADGARAFTARPKWAQAVVLVAGVTMNVLLAWVLFVAVYTMGVPTVVEETAASSDARLFITEVVAYSPAATAGIPALAAVSGVTAGDATLTDFTPTGFRDFVDDHREETLAVTWQVGQDEPVTTTLAPATGIIPDAPEQAAVGVALALVDTVREPFLSSLVTASVTTVTSLRDITMGLFGLIIGAFAGTTDLSQVAGPVGIVGLVGDAADFGLSSLLMFTAIISLNLAIINLLPFPALDGGRLVMVAIEAVKRSPINPVWVLRVNTVGFVILIALMVAVTYSDIIKLL